MQVAVNLELQPLEKRQMIIDTIEVVLQLKQIAPKAEFIKAVNILNANPIVDSVVTTGQEKEIMKIMEKEEKEREKFLLASEKEHEKERIKKEKEDKISLEKKIESEIIKSFLEGKERENVNKATAAEVAETTNPAILPANSLPIPIVKDWLTELKEQEEKAALEILNKMENKVENDTTA
jgi:hypothetical protein